MKKAILFVFSLALTIVQAEAQYAGKEFIRGNASVFFSSNSYSSYDSNASAGGFTAGLSKGKFLTDQKATGFRLEGGLNFYSYKNFRAGQPVSEKDASGIQGFSAGAGKFWQFYKHFGEQWGIYGEPSVNIGYAYSKYFVDPDSENYVRVKSNKYNVGVTLAAGAYYQLSPKWWLNASIGFSNPLSLSFEHRKREGFRAGDRVPGNDVKDNVFAYEFLPVMTLPSVGLGMTYFMR